MSDIKKTNFVQKLAAAGAITAGTLATTQTRADDSYTPYEYRNRPGAYDPNSIHEPSSEERAQKAEEENTELKIALGVAGVAALGAVGSKILKKDDKGRG